MDDEASDSRATASKEAEYEALCRHCGRCCGHGIDPCSCLAERPDGTTYCRAYAGRLGWQTSVSGRRFRCVPIREVKKMCALPPRCGYRFPPPAD